MRVAILLVVLVGCGVDAWPTGAKARPVLLGVSPERLPEWRIAVEQALSTWNWRMNGNDLNHVECAVPIEIAADDDPDACPVGLTAPDQWIHDSSLDGVEADCWIDIRGTEPDGHVSLLIHEFGHAMGLDHSDDPQSIMHEQVKARAIPTDEDVRAAREAVGCAP